MNAQVPLVVLVGPTAAGKSSLALAVAEELQRRGQASEIVNSDSMALYRGMDIGTAKPSAAELARVPHHLIDILEVTQTASVAEFQTLARDTIAELRSRGVLPVLVGGSSLYVRAIIDDFEFPGTDPEVRARWERRLAEVGPVALHAELDERAPEAAAAILPGNGRRIVRALEVIELTGSFTAKLPEPHYALGGVHQFGLRIDREVLDERIANRVDQMWADGLVAEVQALLEVGLAEGLTASRGLGYTQVLDSLAGRCTEDEARRATIDGTRRFARKQLGWFRRDPRIDWIEWDDRGAVEHILAAIEED